MRLVLACALFLGLCGAAAADPWAFEAEATAQTPVGDANGWPVVESKGASSEIYVGTAPKQKISAGLPSFRFAIFNTTDQPLKVSIDDVAMATGDGRALAVIKSDDLALQAKERAMLTSKGASRGSSRDQFRDGARDAISQKRLEIEYEGLQYIMRAQTIAPGERYMADIVFEKPPADADRVTMTFKIADDIHRLAWKITGRN